MDGVKYDSDKPRYDLMPVDAEEEIVKVLTFGARKYDDDNWKKVPELNRRYYAACRRHIEAWRKGEIFDKESRHRHLAHAACCILFLLQNEIENDSIVDNIVNRSGSL